MQDSLDSSHLIKGIELPGHLLDGFIVHREALDRGLNVLLLPRQTLLAGNDATVPSQLAFAHGVPNGSALSAVTFAQDRRLRRALFERARVKKPKGATFSWSSRGRARDWAKQIGFPVSIKEAVGENPPRTIRNVHSPGEVLTAFRDLRKRDESDSTPGSNPHLAGYATTRLTYQLDENGDRLAPARTRILIEREVPGTVTRAFVIEGKVIAAVELDETRSYGVSEAEESLTPELQDVFIRAAEAVPGLACATIDAVVDRPRLRDRLRGRKPSVTVIELSERPRVGAFETVSRELTKSIGTALVQYESQRSGATLSAPEGAIERVINIEGLRYPEVVSGSLPEIFSEHGVNLQVRSVDDIGGKINAVVSGTTETVAVLLELLMSGDLVDDRASAIEYSKGAANA